MRSSFENNQEAKYFITNPSKSLILAKDDLIMILGSYSSVVHLPSIN